MPLRDDRPLEDREYPDPSDVDDVDEGDQPIELVRCPACDGLVWDQAQQCPHCKEWISRAGGTWRDSRKWYVRGGLYIVRTYLLNLLFWLVLLAAAAVVLALEMIL